ncbi:ABC transporter ATP-binding protein [Tepidibacter formicigenes]|jgi:ABC-2 type transport system ATP-binding protein|uniref:ABC-2 type transport system ATP-binding protein n=1 Tax=Tepidibacter formicigenes DSM 15518 TaxID=1123349 RepID=A0A1M6S6S8_9FIRM|nr:ABC transporter ATP-binding protein [Tepidibacter formicigenes]SHK40406.1 ABC-2 type transport system ATP-binding protein [Tepidibacter formicigenes DSM 15518]
MSEIIKIEDVTKKYGDFTAVDKLNLDIEKGSFFGLLGPNGAGKTTLISMLIGLLKPNEGKVFIMNQEMNRNNVFLKKQIGIVPQHINLDKDLTVKENLILAAKLFKLRGKKREVQIEKLLDYMDIKKVENRMARKLSGGMKRKLMIAKALIHSPEILFLDEPTVGVDLNARRKIWDILKIMKDMGKTIILTTHYIEEAEYLCDKIALMDKGKIFYNDTSENLKRSLGKYTVEYFDENKVTKYKFFKDIDEAKNFSNSIKENFILRDISLEDVFYNFTNRKVT